VVKNTFLTGLGRSVIPVLLTYPAFLFNMTMQPGTHFSALPLPWQEGLAAVGWVTLFTLILAFLPLALSVYFGSAVKYLGLRLRDTAVGSIIYIYAVPYFLLFFMQAPLSPLVAIVAVILARSGTRAWAFIEYAITLLSVAAYLLAMRVSGCLCAFSPWFAATALVQIFLLAWMDALFRDRMVTEHPLIPPGEQYGPKAIHPKIVALDKDPLRIVDINRILAVMHRLHPELRRILDLELASGNLVVDATDDEWPAAGNIVIQLAKPFRRHDLRGWGWPSYRRYKRGQIQTLSAPLEEYTIRPLFRPRHTLFAFLPDGADASAGS